MLLQCDIDYQASDTPAGWARSGTLASLGELNAEVLELFATQAGEPGRPEACAEIGSGWGALDAAARARLCGGMVLFADPGFVEGGLARGPEGAAPAGAVAERPAATLAAQGVMTFVWHLARCQANAARLLLGVPHERLARFGELTLGEARALAVRHARCLQPRWHGRPALWRALFAAAARNDASALEQARLHGQALIAADMRSRSAAPVRPRLPPRAAGAPGRLAPRESPVAGTRAETYVRL